MDEQEQENFFRRAEYAKVDREKLFLPSASVSFSPFVEQNKYRLIELNEHLESALRQGEDVVIRGSRLSLFLLLIFQGIHKMESLCVLILKHLI